MTDEHAIREAIHAWLEATKRGDHETLAGLLDDEMLFVVPDRPPFGKKEFLAEPAPPPHRFDSRVDIHEVAIHGDWALSRIRLEIEIEPAPGAGPLKLAGPTMSVWRRAPDGRWRLWRDSNMVAPVG